METTTVLDIHLLCKSITQTLTTEDVRHCMLVCRNWHVVFGPYLLQTITIRKWSSIDTFMSLRVQELFNRYAANVRSIHSSSDNIWPTLLSVPLKNLTVLGIHSIDLGKRYRQSDQNQTSLLLSFFRSSPKIEVLKLGFFEAEQVQDVLSAVLGLQYLRKLSIQNTDPTDCHTVRRFLLSCYGLEKVHVWFFALEDAPIPTPAQDAQELLQLTGSENPYFKVHDVSLNSQTYDHSIDYMYYSFLKRCSALERFSVPGNASPGAGPRLAAILTAHTRRLRHLHTQKSFLSGEEVAGLIVACYRLESFVGAIKQQDPELVMSALLEHRDTLEVVDLKRIGVSKATGLMMHSLLSPAQS